MSEQITIEYVAQMQKVTADATVKAVREWVARQRDFCQQHYWGGRVDACTAIIDHLDSGLNGAQP